MTKPFRPGARVTGCQVEPPSSVSKAPLVPVASTQSLPASSLTWSPSLPAADGPGALGAALGTTAAGRAREKSRLTCAENDLGLETMAAARPMAVAQKAAAIPIRKDERTTKAGLTVSAVL